MCDVGFCMTLDKRPSILKCRSRVSRRYHEFFGPSRPIISLCFLSQKNNNAQCTKHRKQKKLSESIKKEKVLESEKKNRKNQSKPGSKKEQGKDIKKIE